MIVVGKIARLFELRDMTTCLPLPSGIDPRIPRIRFLLGDGPWRQRFEAMASNHRCEDASVFQDWSRRPRLRSHVALMDCPRSPQPSRRPPAGASAGPGGAAPWWRSTAMARARSVGTMKPGSLRPGRHRWPRGPPGPPRRDPALRVRLGETGRSWVSDRFSVERLVNDQHALYLPSGRGPFPKGMGIPSRAFPFNAYFLAFFGGLCVTRGVRAALARGVNGVDWWTTRATAKSMERRFRSVADSPSSPELQPSLLGGAAAIQLRLLDPVAVEGPTYGLWPPRRELGAIVIGAPSPCYCCWAPGTTAGVKPAAKFAGQAAIALLVAAAGVRVTLFVPSLLFGYAITVLWILTVTNAVNFKRQHERPLRRAGDDRHGMDRLPCRPRGTVCTSSHCWPFTAGSLLGFLPFNFPVPRCFSGTPAAIWWASPRSARHPSALYPPGVDSQPLGRAQPLFPAGGAARTWPAWSGSAPAGKAFWIWGHQSLFPPARPADGRPAP